MKRLKRVLLAMVGRAGLWGFLFCVVFAAAGFGFAASEPKLYGYGSTFSLAVDASDAPVAASDLPLPPQDLDWRELPGFEDGRLLELPPTPGSNAVMSTSVTDRDGVIGNSVKYQIDYADGSKYVAYLSPIGDTEYSYEPYQTALQRIAPPIFAVAAIISAVVGLMALLFAFFGVDPGATRLSTEAVEDPYAQALLGRWMKRSRFYRLLGGLSGFLVAMARNLDGRILVNELVVGVVGGIVVGGALAEFHLLRRKPQTIAAADLTVRRFSDFSNAWDRRAMVAIAAASMCFIVGSMAGLWYDSAGRRSAVLAMVVVAAAAGTQYVVFRRPRPALDAQLRRADDLLRYLASTHGFARPAIALALLFLSAALGQQLTGAVAWVLYISLNLLALGWLLMGRHGRIPRVVAARLAQ